MKLVDNLRGCAVWMACLGLLIPHSAVVAAPIEKSQLIDRSGQIAQQPVAIDVALHEGGVLVGQIVDEQGASANGSLVSIQQNGQQLAETTTDTDGRFVVRGLQGGVYQITTAQGGGLYRFWATNTAPPSAQPGVLVVNGEGVVRGQFGGMLLSFLSNPWVIASLVAAAIAIPLALDDNSAS